MKYLVIPTFEPDEKLLSLLRELKTIENLFIIIVNDGSDYKYDNIFDEAKKYAKIISYKENKGKGYALKTAFKYIKENRYQGIVITADSDGQHNKRDILRIANSVNDNNSLVCGIRNFKERVPYRSKIGNKVTERIFSLLTGIDLSDTQCGLRAFSTELLDYMLIIKGNRFEYEMNVLLKFARNIDIKGINIDTIYIEENKSSHFNIFKDSYLIFMEILKFMFYSLISFIIDYICYSILITILFVNDTIIKITISNILARIISGSINYMINKNIVFKNKNKNLWYKYLLLAIFILIINTMILLLLNILGLKNLYIIKIIAEIILFSISYIIQKKLIFKNRGEK